MRSRSGGTTGCASPAVALDELRRALRRAAARSLPRRSAGTVGAGPHHRPRHPGVRRARRSAGRRRPLVRIGFGCAPRRRASALQRALTELNQIFDPDDDRAGAVGSARDRAIRTTCTSDPGAAARRAAADFAPVTTDDLRDDVRACVARAGARGPGDAGAGSDAAGRWACARSKVVVPGPAPLLAAPRPGPPLRRARCALGCLAAPLDRGRSSTPSPILCRSSEASRWPGSSTATATSSSRSRMWRDSPAARSSGDGAPTLVDLGARSRARDAWPACGSSPVTAAPCHGARPASPPARLSPERAQLEMAAHQPSAPRSSRRADPRPTASSRAMDAAGVDVAFLYPDHTPCTCCAVDTMAPARAAAFAQRLQPWLARLLQPAIRSACAASAAHRPPRSRAAMLAELDRVAELRLDERWCCGPTRWAAGCSAIRPTSRSGRACERRGIAVALHEGTHARRAHGGRGSLPEPLRAARLLAPDGA